MDLDRYRAHQAPSARGRLSKPLTTLEVDRGIHGPQTVVGRLREYARVRHEEQPNVYPSQNTLYRVMQERENAGARGGGIQYDIVQTEDDLEGTPVPPDGGLGELVDRLGRNISRFARAQEIATAINQMPKQYRHAVAAIYHVEQRERCRSMADAAGKLGMPKSTFQLLIGAAYGWLEGRLDLPVDRYQLGVDDAQNTTACVVRSDSA